jgi:DNA-binding NtrC family response regulator
MLAEMGCSVTLCGNGQEAVEYYRENAAATDLVILDLLMPGLSGPAALSELLRINPGARVIAMTGHTQNPQVRDMVNQGVRGLLLKPFRFADFSKEVNRILSGV